MSVVTWKEVVRLAGSRWWLVVPVAMVIALYVFICSAGRAGPWPVYMTYYDLLAEGFRSGHLYVPVEPSSELLAKADPYDPAFQKLWLWDASLYRGKYYMYWGPVPALLQALAKTLLGIRGMIGDQYLAFAAFCLSAIFGGLIIDRFGRRLFVSVPRWLRGLGILTFACANPAPYLVATGGVYQTSIAFGQAFSLAGLLFAFDAVWLAPAKPSKWRLAVVGLFFALAVGSRIGMLPAVSLLVGVTILACAWPARVRVREAILDGCLIGGPLALGVCLLLLYNWLRFDKWLEFGTNNQLSTLKFRLSPSYWLTNLYSYSLRPYFPECRFPYVTAPWWPGRKAFPGWTSLPDGYLINEPVVGWLRVVQITWLLPVVPFVVAQRLRQFRQSSAGGAADSGAVERCPRVFLWCVACFAILGTVSGSLVMGLYMSTMRYLGDVTNGLVLLSLVGAFALYSWARRERFRIVATGVAVGPALATIGFGLLLGYQGYGKHFQTHNPKLDGRVVGALSLCSAPSDPEPRRP